jgi:putative transcriptional regulator
MQKLREFREKTGLSQYNMARKMDVSMSFYEKVERGQQGVSGGFMQKLKRAFPEISIDEIFFSDIEGVAQP